MIEYMTNYESRIVEVIGAVERVELRVKLITLSHYSM